MPSLPGESTFATLGGPFVDATPVEDPTTDLSSTQFNEAIGSVAAASHTVPRAWVRILGHATTPTVVVPGSLGTPGHGANWGGSSPVIPLLTRNGTGDITITWPASVTAEDGTTQTPLFIAGTAQITGTTFGFATVSVTSANVARLRLASAAGAANDFVGIEIFIVMR